MLGRNWQTGEALSGANCFSRKWIRAGRNSWFGSGFKERHPAYLGPPWTAILCRSRTNSGLRAFCVRTTSFRIDTALSMTCSRIGPCSFMSGGNSPTSRTNLRNCLLGWAIASWCAVRFVSFSANSSRAIKKAKEYLSSARCSAGPLVAKNGARKS